MKILTFVAAAFGCASVLAATSVTAPVVAPASVTACQTGAATAASAASTSIASYACKLDATVAVTYTPPPIDLSGYVKCADENGTCVINGSGVVRYGDTANGKFTADKRFAASTPCTNAVFGDPDYGTVKVCVLKIDALTYIDKTKIPKPIAPGTAGNQTGPVVITLTQQQQTDPTGPFMPVASDVGAFREACSFSHMLYDDPLVFPGQPGASHLHTFLGAGGADAYLTGPNQLDAAHLAMGSTCAGGTLNMTAYWIPAVIDTNGGVPIAPQGSLIYYKTGYGGVKPAQVVAPPNGLHIIAGSAMNRDPAGQPNAARYACIGPKGQLADGGGWAPTIAGMLAMTLKSSTPYVCGPGSDVMMEVSFPQCWDGVNLDSPNHQSHMAYPNPYVTPAGCPADHPIAIPIISYEIHYAVTATSSPSTWRLSSDPADTSVPAGVSAHGDYFIGWDRPTIDTFVKNCLQASKDCHAYLLGDGRMLQ